MEAANSHGATLARVVFNDRNSAAVDVFTRMYTLNYTRVSKREAAKLS